MARTITELGPREVEFLARQSGRGEQLLTTEHAIAYWGSAEYAWKVLSRLESKGWLERVQHGSYMIVPLDAGAERIWSEDALAVGTFLAPEGAAAYWTAVRHWNWTTQLPRIVTFATPKRRFNMHPVALSVQYRFVLVKPAKIFGVATCRENALAVRVTDRERTVVDMMDRTDLCGGIAEVVESLRLAWPQLDYDRLTGRVREFGSGTVPKRLGFLVEHLGLEVPSSSLLAELRAMVGSGFSPLVRGGSQSGLYMRRWNLRLNAAGFGEPESRSSSSSS
jgi:predicted transcriptional regulator of viral defense system